MSSDDDERQEPRTSDRTAGSCRPLRRRSPRAAAVVLGTGASVLVLASLAGVGPAASAASRRATRDPAFLQVVDVAKYGQVLADAQRFSLYALDTERGAKLVCTAACQKVWPPVLVSTKVASVSLGAGVDGVVGFVKRSAATKQVTFDGYPLYRFVADTGPRQTHGEGVVHFGGTWMLLHPSPLVPAAPAAGATGPSSTTSTTSPGGGSGGYYG